MNIGFHYPFFFLLSLFFICFFRCKRESLKIYFSKTEFLSKFSLYKRSFLSFFVFFLLVLSLSAPFSYDFLRSDTKKGRDLVLALDVSGSMGMDMGGKSKFEALLEVAREFLKKRFDDNIAVVAFGTFAYIASPITYDLKALAFLLDYLDVSVAGNNTAIGEAIERSLDAIEKSNAKNRVIVLITDGYHNSGSISPKDAVERAKKMKVKIYTIGIGEDADRSLLKKISSSTGAKSFFAKNKEDLKRIFRELDSLEKSPLKSGYFENKRELFFIPLVFAVVLLLFEVRRYL
ncbi:MAG: VWA domain-containing protein [Epsilonproteobacteria bacterium]|nr:VWA domain-containing protein [Campylobacterota bacterium]